MKKTPHIGTLNEKSLHAALKQYYSRPGDQFEVPLGKHVIDIVRDDLLIEIQTKGFSSINKKLSFLTMSHPVRLVYPISVDKYLVKMDEDGINFVDRRKSPKHGTVEDLFAELVSIPILLTNPNFSIDVLIIIEEEVRKIGQSSYRRRKWSIIERRLLEVMEHIRFDTATDLLSLIPDGIKQPFNTLDLAQAIGKRRRLAQQMVYCMRKMNLITIDGKQGNSILYVNSIK